MRSIRERERESMSRNAWYYLLTDTTNKIKYNIGYKK